MNIKEIAKRCARELVESPANSEEIVAIISKAINQAVTEAKIEFNQTHWQENPLSNAVKDYHNQLVAANKRIAELQELLDVANTFEALNRKRADSLEINLRDARELRHGLVQDVHDLRIKLAHLKEYVHRRLLVLWKQCNEYQSGFSEQMAAQLKEEIDSFLDLTITKPDSPTPICDEFGKQPMEYIPVRRQAKFAQSAGKTKRAKSKGC